MATFATLVVYFELVLLVILLMFLSFAYATDRLTVRRIGEGDHEIIRITLTPKPQQTENIELSEGETR